jgi:hypothetical protein
MFAPVATGAFINSRKRFPFLTRCGGPLVQAGGANLNVHKPTAGYLHIRIGTCRPYG